MSLFLGVLISLLAIVYGNYDVIILGAGVSGLGAALKLQKLGITNFVVLEAKDYIGGRIHHEMMGGDALEMGAGWIHWANDNHVLMKLARPYKLKTQQENYNNIEYRWANGTIIEAKQHKSVLNELKYREGKMFKIVEQRVKQGKDSVSGATGLRMAGWRVDNPLKQAVEYFRIDFENAVRSDFISATSFDVTGSGTDFAVTDSRGYISPFLNAIPTHVRSKIRLNHEVAKVTSGLGVHMVHTNRGLFTGTHVLVTFSSGVLLSKQVKFVPVLPQWKMEALSLTPMAHYCKLFFKFSNTFWDTSKRFLMVVGGDRRGYFQHWMNIEVGVKTPTKHLLLATLTGDFCKESATMSHQMLTDHAYQVLKKLYKHATKPIALKYHPWSTDRHTLGSYSTQVSGITVADFRALQHPVGTSLWFTGEYTGVEYGYTHGAYELGEDTAQRMYACIRARKFPASKPA